ncbi:MAG: response regulator, partial [Myxococcota bacterium]
MTTTVLIADRDPFNLRTLEELLEGAGYHVVTAPDGGSVLDSVARQRPTLAILDIDLPVRNGTEVMQILKSEQALADIAILIVTDEEDESSRSRAIEGGAADCITRPYRMVDVQQRVAAALRMRATETELAQVKKNSQVDTLTHAGNSHQFAVSLDYEMTRSVRFNHPLTCGLVEVVNLEALRSVGGIDTEESVLVQLGTGLRSCIRSIDLFFRAGQSEFGIILPETRNEGAKIVMDRVHEFVAGGRAETVD